MTAQIVMLILLFAGLLITAKNHGKPREDYDFWISAISAIFQIALLYLGGFFDCFFK